jgi:hypothetical protein
MGESHEAERTNNEREEEYGGEKLTEIRAIDIEQLGQTIQSGLLGVCISLNNINETMKAILEMIKNE